MPGSGIRVKAHAKVNICLKITGKRPDGYHDLFSVMVPVDLCDNLDISLNNTGLIKIHSSGFSVPTDNTNLVFKAAESFFLKTGIENRGIKIKLDKKIPVAAGLGGGVLSCAQVRAGLCQGKPPGKRLSFLLPPGGMHGYIQPRKEYPIGDRQDR